ncbi:hypothetical protein AX16_010392 [Volvariella volvacea WC 439]|nr:hypothetical protein AX16_010392 [Volvariella volvacea WC 439]
MSLLCQVTDLALDCNWQGASTLAGKDASPLTASSFFLPIARALWHACLKSLRILDIRANVDVMQMIVRDMAAPNSIQGLRLHFHLRTPCTSRYQDIASLIQRRFPRIKHMTISTSPRLDASFIFPALGRFSNLQTVSLALSMRYRAMELRRVAKFVLENESVQTLSVEGALVAPEDAQSFTELLSPHPRGDTTGPTNLTLSISVLSPQLVDFLAAKLKGLKTLNLIVGKIVDSSFEIDLVSLY